MSDNSRDSSPASRSRSRSRSSASSRSPSRSVSRSRSRSFSSSSSSPRFVSATDSEAEQAKKNVPDSPKRNKVKHKKSPAHNRSSGSDSEDGEEEAKKAKSKPKKPVGKKKKKKGGKAEASEEGEVSSEEDSNKEFDDGLDEDLIGDDADRAKLEKMTEREREEELFKRAENRESLKKRFEIQKKLKQQQKLTKKSATKPSSEEEEEEEEDEDLYNNVQDTKERSQNRQKTMEANKFDQKSSALSELKAKRQERERKEVERKSKAEAVKGSGDDEGRSRSKAKSGRRSSSSSSSSSPGGGSVRSRRSSTSSQSSSSDGSDTERFKKSPSKVQKYIETQEDLEPIRLSRYKMERFVHLPFFRRLVQNCFVRIGIGQHQGRSVYRAAEIVDVVETGKVYSVGAVRTNVGLKLKFGRQERVFRLEFISNQRFVPQEFARWRETCAESSVALPTVEFVRSKAADIRKAVNYEYTSDDVDKIVAQKERFSKHPINYAMHKARLMKEKEIAMGNGDEERARELERKLNEHEERAEELDKKRTSTISSVSLINDRNRKANVSKAEAAIRMEIRRKREEGVVANPFTRRKCNPRIVTKSVVAAAANADADKADDASATEKENVVVKVGAADKRSAGGEGGDLDGEREAKRPKKAKLPGGGGGGGLHNKEDLFDAHNFDIEIDVDTAAAIGPAAAVANINPAAGRPAAAAGEKAGAAATKRSFNLDDYKKKRGLM